MKLNLLICLPRLLGIKSSKDLSRLLYDDLIAAANLLRLRNYLDLRHLMDLLLRPGVRIHNELLNRLLLALLAEDLRRWATQHRRRLIQRDVSDNSCRQLISLLFVFLLCFNGFAFVVIVIESDCGWRVESGIDALRRNLLDNIGGWNHEGCLPLNCDELLAGRLDYSLGLKDVLDRLHLVVARRDVLELILLRWRLI